MAVPYSTRFFWGSVAAGSTSSPQTVPLNYIWILRDVETRQNPSNSAEVILNLGSPVQANLTLVPSAQYWAQWQGRVVLNAGDAFTVEAVGNAAGVVVSGYALANT
jgi:hypothetical protein